MLDGDATFAITESVVGPEWPLASENGVEALTLIEVAAQTAGVSCSWQRIREKGMDSTQTGWIVAIKKVSLHLDHLPGALLPFGMRIRAEGKNTINYGGFQEVSAALFADSVRLGEVVLQLYQPQDAE